MKKLPVDELSIREAYRDKGFGTAALQFVEEVYRKSGFRDHDRYFMTK
jgi:GNAT superfamily N-acetyltransferase